MQTKKGEHEEEAELIRKGDCSHGIGSQAGSGSSADAQGIVS